MGTQQLQRLRTRSVDSQGTAGPSDPWASAYFEDQIGRINGQPGNLDPQLDVGRQNILGCFNEQSGQLNIQASRARRDYDTRS